MKRIKGVNKAPLLQYPRHKIISSLAELWSRAAPTLRARQGTRLVLTSGSFDYPLHVEHLRYLRTAASFGDCLCVALDSDTRIRARKGAERPIAPFSMRACTLALLEHVDLVYAHNGEDEALIERLHPDVFVQSESTKEEPVAAKAGLFRRVIERGGMVRILPVSTSFRVSTSELIAQIKKM